MRAGGGISPAVKPSRRHATSALTRWNQSEQTVPQFRLCQISSLMMADGSGGGGGRGMKQVKQEPPPVAAGLPRCLLIMRELVLAGFWAGSATAPAGSAGLLLNDAPPRQAPSPPSRSTCPRPMKPRRWTTTSPLG